MWLQAPNINCTHGFSTRQGGVSSGAFSSLNLGGSQDSRENIQTNRIAALSAIGLSMNKLCTLKQVHGTTVCNASIFPQEGDALVTDNSSLTLAVSIADCYPVLFHDPVASVIGAAHAGWRGTVGKISAEVVKAMVNLGSNVEDIQVAIGQGICQDNFEVGPEVIEQFLTAGFPPFVIDDNKIDLVKSNRFVLGQSGIPVKNIWAMNRCTFEDDFFSHRRDNGVTGRMWGLISLKKT